ncbi:MAG: insulinase family protein [Prevotellaceae bacterium]|nr:insulinase family protein [Candidatus Minthosoma caballi]
MLLNKHTLDNGLRIVHAEDKSTQMVTLNVLYKVGSRNESPEHTGFAHLFEHLMFGGSVNIPNYDNPLQLACGDNNAFTTFDYTNYYLTLPAVNVETGFWLESDRMLSLAFTPESLEVQRKVVMEEFKQHYLTPPYGDLQHLMSALAYKVHPYRWPTIGLELSHIANVQMDEVKDFFFRFYAPNNAILSVVGNISFDETVRLAEKWFGKVPRRNICTATIPQEPEQTEQRRLTVKRMVPNDVLYMTFPIVGVMHPDFHCCDMISDILSIGRSCRLNRHLVEERHLFTELDAFVIPHLDPGQLSIIGSPAEGVNIEDAEAAVWEELENLCQNGVSDEEIEKVKNKFETNFMRERSQRQKLATQLAFYEMLGDAEWIDKEIDEYRSITKERFMSVCRNVLQKQKANVLHYLSSAKDCPREEEQ